MTAREMTPERLAEVRERADRWGAVPFAAAGSLGDYIRKANRAHEWPGDDDRDENRDAVDRAADDPDEEVVGMLVDAVRLASRDRADLLANVDALTARLETAERERDEARRFLSGQHAMVASGHSHSLLCHEHQCTIDAMQGIEVREREAVAMAWRQRTRAEAAEAKLAALVEAVAASVMVGPFSVPALRAALRAARGEP